MSCTQNATLGSCAFNENSNGWSFISDFVHLSPKGYTGIPYLEAVVLFNVAVYLFHSYLDVRQLKVSLAKLDDSYTSVGRALVSQSIKR